MKKMRLKNNDFFVLINSTLVKVFNLSLGQAAKGKKEKRGEIDGNSEAI